jgi:hypothetical protein
VLPKSEQVGVGHDADRFPDRVHDRRVMEAPVEHQQEHLAGHRIVPYGARGEGHNLADGRLEAPPRGDDLRPEVAIGEDPQPVVARDQ